MLLCDLKCLNTHTHPLFRFLAQKIKKHIVNKTRADTIQVPALYRYKSDYSSSGCGSGCGNSSL